MRLRGMTRALAKVALTACFAFAGHETMAMDGHESRIFIAEPTIDTDHTNPDSNTWPRAIVGYVGKPIHLSIKYEIGTFTSPDTGGSLTLESNEIPNPEYMYFCADGETCDLGGVLGLSFDFASGTINGVPTKTGAFTLFPAVRDINKGEDAYNGQGFWWTTFTTSGGKTWSEAKSPIVILILPSPGPKRVDLQCTFSTGNAVPLLLTLDFDSGYVETLGNDGNLAGVYKINNPDGDVIGWSGGAAYMNGVSLNRTNGILTAAGPSGAQTAHCDKRSTKRAF